MNKTRRRKARARRQEEKTRRQRRAVLKAATFPYRFGTAELLVLGVDPGATPAAHVVLMHHSDGRLEIIQSDA